MEISPGDSVFFHAPGCSDLPGEMLLLGPGGPADQESPGVSREAFLQASHQYEEHNFGCRAKTACVFSSADKSREEKDANISGMCPAAFCASTLEYNTNVTKKDSTE